MTKNLEILHRERDFILCKKEETFWLFTVNNASLTQVSATHFATKQEKEFLIADIREQLKSIPTPIAPISTNQISALNLNLTSRCALDCIYCYADGGDYQRLAGELTLETILEAIEKGLPNIDQNKEFRFEFFGGEPLLNPTTIDEVLAWEETQKMIPSPIVNRISTSINRPLDEAGLARLKKGEFILSVSIDGNRHTQNRQRPFKDGRGSFDEIIANLRKIKAQHPELITVARMTVHSQAATILDELKELRALNLFDYCSIYCAAVEDETTGQVMMSDEFRQNYLTMAAEYNQLIQEDNNIFKGCLELNRYLSHILHGTGVHHHCRAGNGYFTLSPDGTVHPCHRFIGDVSEAIPGGLAALQTVLPNWKKSVGEKPECADCTIRYFCGGGCNQENYITNGDLLTPAAGGCAFAELLFEAALSAAISLNESTRTSLLNSTKELPRLFVFCGQVVHKF